MLTPIYEQTPDFNYVIAFLGYAFAKSGQSAKAHAFILKLEESQKGPGVHRPSIIFSHYYTWRLGIKKNSKNVMKKV